MAKKYEEDEAVAVSDETVHVSSACVISGFLECYFVHHSTYRFDKVQFIRDLSIVPWSAARGDALFSPRCQSASMDHGGQIAR